MTQRHLVCLLVLLVCPLRAPAQGVAERYAGLSGAIARTRQMSSVEGLRKLLDLVGRVGRLPFEEGDPLRARAEKLLRGIIVEADGEKGFGVCGAGYLALGRIARGEASLRFLLQAYARADRGLSLQHRQAVRALGALSHPQAVHLLARTGLRSRAPRHREAALLGLSRLEHPLLVRAAREHGAAVLAQLSAQDGDLRRAALLAAGNLSLAAALPLILRCCADPSAALRAAAGRALGGFADSPSALSGLHELLEDPVDWVREAAVPSVARFGGTRACALLIPRLRHEPLRVRALMCDVLRRLAAVDLDDEAPSWERWWKNARSDPRRGDGSPVTSRPVKRMRYGPRYYGIPVRSDRALFIIDTSMSMRFGGREGDPRRMDIARTEFERTVNGMAPTMRFNAFVFSTGNAYLRRKGLLSATERNKAHAVRWLRSILPAGGTDSFGALKAGLRRFPDVDTIFFLSDGKPSRGMITDPEKIVARIVEMNRARKVRINTIALLKTDPLATSLSHDDVIEPAVRFMRQLALATGGTFVRRDG